LASAFFQETSKTSTPLLPTMLFAEQVARENRLWL
jgi:hypothetical protein